MDSTYVPYPAAGNAGNPNAINFAWVPYYFL